MSEPRDHAAAVNHPEIMAFVKPEGKRVLDVGCAAGATMLAAGAIEVVGIAGDAPSATHARKHMTATYQYDLDKLPALPYPDGYFDVITVGDQARDAGAVLKTLRRYLRDDGQIICPRPHAKALSSAGFEVVGDAAAVVAAKPVTKLAHEAPALPNMWRNSREDRVLVVPYGDRHWQHTLASVVEAFDKNDSVTLGIPLAAADLDNIPADIERIVGERVDTVLIEAPQDDEGWTRLVAGSSAVVIAKGQGDLEDIAERVGVDRIATKEAPAATADITAPRMYLDLMKRTLTNVIYGDPDLSRNAGFDVRARALGRDWPKNAHTMVGLVRLNNLQVCVEDVIKRGVPGHLIETGVWRGGATIFMRAILKAYGVTDRDVYVCDSFEGLPRPNEKLYPADRGDKHHEQAVLAVSLEEVMHNFDVYGLLDDKVKFLKGWFKDSLPTLPADMKFAVVRLDGDMYESTMDGFRHLYDKLSVGGYMIVDDYGAVAACAKATHDFRSERGITDPIKNIDGLGVFWQKTK